MDIELLRCLQDWIGMLDLILWVDLVIDEKYGLDFNQKGFVGLFVVQFVSFIGGIEVDFDLDIDIYWWMGYKYFVQLI